MVKKKLLAVWSKNSYGESLNKICSLGLWPGRLVIRHAQVKMAAAYERKPVKQWLMDLSKVRLAEKEKKGILPRSQR